MDNQNKRQQGFTLIEIMVVLVILGVMAALVVPRVIGRAEDAKIVAAKSDIASIMNALKLYRLDNVSYPTNQQGLQALVSKPTVGRNPENYKAGGYLERLPKDPWGNAYNYNNPGVHGEIDVYSVGPNADTGSGENSPGVIGNWQ